MLLLVTGTQQTTVDALNKPESVKGGEFKLTSQGVRCLLTESASVAGTGRIHGFCRHRLGVCCAGGEWMDLCRFGGGNSGRLVVDVVVDVFKC